MLLRIYNKHYVAGSWPALFQEHFCQNYSSFPRAFGCFLLLFSKSKLLLFSKSLSETTKAYQLVLEIGLYYIYCLGFKV